MRKLAPKVEYLIGSFPNDREEILPYLEKIRKYSSECGCSLGATFLTASFGIFFIYSIFFHVLEIVPILKQLILGILFVFISSLLGKLLGIGIARIRLEFLYRYLIDKYQIRGE